MRKTYIISGSTRLVTRRDRGAVRGEDRLEAREARGEGMLDLCIKHLETAMLQPVPRQDQRLLVGLRTSRVIHLRVTRLHHLAVVLYLLPGVAVVMGAASGGAEATGFFLRIMSYTMTS
jgi:hypothetical protein